MPVSMGRPYDDGNVTASDDLYSVPTGTLMDMGDLRELDLKHLEALEAVAEEGTFGRAATRLGYTQSAVSQQIASLEVHLGTSLMVKTGRRVVLTEAGERYFEMIAEKHRPDRRRCANRPGILVVQIP